MSLSPNQYQTEAARTEASQKGAAGRLLNDLIDPYALNPEDLKAIRLLHGVIGLSNEKGEITSLIQKRYWYGKPISDADMAERIRDEAGDMCWHLMQVLSSFGIKFQDVLDGNIAKLKARYPDAGWSAEACENRDREAEAKALGNEVIDS